MELRHLRYFVAVVEEQSFTKAAEKLYIAQPPLSRQIQNLESELGISLFERGSRPLKTTEAGQFFYQHAVKLLSNAEEVKSMTKRIGLIEKTVTMGFVGSLLYGLLPKIVYMFRQQQPHLKIELVEMSTKDQIQALKEGRIDVGFGRLRISDPAVRRVLLREEPLMLAVHISHPLADSKGTYFADIEDENLFLYPSHPKPNFSTQEVREIQLALGLVAAGEGVCVVPESAKTIQLPNLIYIPMLDSSAKSPMLYGDSFCKVDGKAKIIRSLFRLYLSSYDLKGYSNMIACEF
ncbi:hypothetical protein FQR65_LT19258 [Abscondita terminalis]|nr:hypothetical protein FQR65_LT19258 [Abscondita terminalis]